jgi:hypothetical protein
MVPILYLLSDSKAKASNVCNWHIADIDFDAENVRLFIEAVHGRQMLVAVVKRDGRKIERRARLACYDHLAEVTDKTKAGDVGHGRGLVSEQQFRCRAIGVAHLDERRLLGAARTLPFAHFRAKTHRTT